MKILLLVPVHTEYKKWSSKKIKGIPYYQGQASWVKALEKMGHKVSVFTYNDPIIISPLNIIHKYMPLLYAKFRRRLEKYYFLNFNNYLRSEKLKRKIKIFKPDVIIISGGITTILPNVFNNLDSKIYLLSGVNPKTSSTDLEKRLIKEKIIDLVVENDRGYANGWKKLGAKDALVLPISSADPDLHKPLDLTEKEKKELGADVLFVGSITQDRLIKLSVFSNFNFKFWGDIKPGVTIPNRLKKFYYGEASGEKMIKILNAGKIVINLQPKDMSYGGNMRTFEIPATGAFMLADRVDLGWFKTVKPVTFKNMKDAVEKVKYYLNHENERLFQAKSLRKYVLKHHTYEDHFKKLLSK